MPRTTQPLSSEYILLGFLSEGPMHGYEIFKAIQTNPDINQIFSVKLSLLYAMLEKLEEMGLVNHEVIDIGTLPVRRVYAINSNGMDAFVEWRGTPVDHPREIRQEFLARLYFAYSSGKQASRELLSRQLDVCRQWQQLHQVHISETEGDVFSRVLLDFKQSQIDSISNWIEFTLGSL